MTKNKKLGVLGEIDKTLGDFRIFRRRGNPDTIFLRKILLRIISILKKQSFTSIQTVYQKLLPVFKKAVEILVFCLHGLQFHAVT